MIRSKKPGVGRLTELSTPAVAESIAKKDAHNRKRDWAKKGSRKGAPANKAGKAEPDSSNDDSSDDAEVASGHAARSIAVKEAMTASALTTQVISEALAKGKSKRKTEGCKVSQHTVFRDSDDDDEYQSKKGRIEAYTAEVGQSGRGFASGFAAGGTMKVGASATKGAPSASAHNSSAQNIYFIVQPPKTLAQTIPEYFLLVDTGATHHMVNMSFWLAYLVESYIQVAWGGIDSSARALGIGHMVFTTYALGSTLDDKPPKQVLMTSGQADTLLVPDVSRPLAASNRWSAQGHTPHLQEMNPGLIGFENSFFVPFCYERDTGYFLCPCYPPPTQALFQAEDNARVEVIDLNCHIDDGSYKSLYMHQMVSNGSSTFKRS